MVFFSNLRLLALPLLTKESTNRLLFIYFSLENSNSEINFPWPIAVERLEHPFLISSLARILIRVRFRVRM